MNRCLNESMTEGLPVEPGLCGHCRHALIRPTRRGTVYLRCGRAEWDPAMDRYPRLPVLECAGYDKADPGPG
jgi:hypothetical protein